MLTLLVVLVNCFTFPGLIFAQEKHVRNGTAVSQPSYTDNAQPDVAGKTEVRQLQSKIYDVVVIGAGWAGLGASRALKNGGVDNFLVLEGSNYIGGRCKTVPIGSGGEETTAELGCQWIHGNTNANPVYKVANNLGFEIVRDGHTGVYWSNGDGRIADSEVDSRVRRNFNNDFMPFQERLQDSTNQDSSLGGIAKNFINKRKMKSMDRRVFDFSTESEIVHEYAASLEDMSLWWWNSDREMRGSDAIILGQKGTSRTGYSGLLNAYAAPILKKIQLESVVTNINYSKQINVVTYRKGSKTTQVKARNVIISVSLGVLKSGSIVFQPRLPISKRNAIKKLGIGLLNKIIMKWNSSTNLPWPSNKHWIEKIAPVGQQQRWCEFWSARMSTGENILVAFSAGREAQRVENLSDAATRAEVMSSIRGMFGNVPDPVQVIVSKWGKSELSQGSYSFFKVGASPKNRKQLKATVQGRLFFAGEATNRNYPSTTHGALISGEAAGKSVVKKLKR